MAMYSIIRRYGLYVSNFQTSLVQLNMFYKQLHVMRKNISSSNSSPFWKHIFCSLNVTSDFNTFGNKYACITMRHCCTTDVESHDIKRKEISTKCSFQKELHLRQKQAECSVLIELPRKTDAQHACAHCQEFGDIEKVFSYSGESNNMFLLIEFSKKETVDNLLSACQCSNILDTFPVFSRLIQYKRKVIHDLQKVVTIIEDHNPESPSAKSERVSELIETIYLTEKLSELNIRLRYFFCALLKDSVSGVFPYCEVVPFGSSVNGVGKHGCDLDVIIRLYPKKINSENELLFLSKTCVGDERALQQRAIFCLGDFIRTFLPGVSSLQKIIHARVPIMKLKHRILKMDCDVSINNMPAVLMSELIYFCGEIDYRVRPLIYTVKRWAKEANITSEVPGAWITNFALSMLVIFFLQNRPSAILPAFNDAVEIIDDKSSTELIVHYRKSLSDLKSKASLNKETLAVLLQEFLMFLGTYPFSEKHISLLTGSALPRNDGSPIWIQYPMEENLNVTKNVSHHEMWDLCEKAFASSKYFASNMNHKVSKTQDLASLLGIPNIKRLDLKKTPKIDIGLLMNSNQNKSMKKKPVKKLAF